MIENGHFAELENIVRLTRRKGYVSSVPFSLQSSSLTSLSPAGRDEPDDDYVDDFATAVTKHSKVDAIPPRTDMRTFVFSATMSKDLQRNLKKRNRRYKPGQPEDGMSSLGESEEGRRAQ